MHDVAELLLFHPHGIEGNILRCLNGAAERSRVLLREKPFGNE